MRGWWSTERRAGASWLLTGGLGLASSRIYFFATVQQGDGQARITTTVLQTEAQFVRFPRAWLVWYGYYGSS